MYSWTDYQLAMNKINNSLLEKNSRSNKAWVRFPINEIPLSDYRLGQLLNQIQANGYGRKRFLPNGYLWSNNGLVSYKYYLNRLGHSNNKKKKWESYASQIGAVYVLANKWILITPDKFPTNDIMVYWFDKDNKINGLNVGGIINEFFNSQSATSDESQYWSGGLNPETYNKGYSLAPHKDDDGSEQYFWHPNKEGYVNMRDIKALTEAVYNRGKTVEPVDSKEALKESWQIKFSGGQTLYEDRWKKKAEFIHGGYRFALPVIEPPRTEFIINYTNQITTLLKT